MIQPMVGDSSMLTLVLSLGHSLHGPLIVSSPLSYLAKIYSDLTHIASATSPSSHFPLAAPYNYDRPIPIMTTTTSKKILVLGSGMVASPCLEYLSRSPANYLTVGEFVRPSKLHRGY